MGNTFEDVCSKLEYYTKLQSNIKKYCQKRRKFYQERNEDIRQLSQLLSNALEYYGRISTIIRQQVGVKQKDFKEILTLLERTMGFIEFSKKGCIEKERYYQTRLSDLKSIEMILDQSIKYYENVRNDVKIRSTDLEMEEEEMTVKEMKMDEKRMEDEILKEIR